MARMTSAFSVTPFLSSQILPGYVRNSIILSFALFLYPVVSPGIPENVGSMVLFGAIIFKEIVIGILIGYLASIVFWAAECVGSFIDNQRGATMGSSINPMTETEDSPLGIMLQLVLIVLFFTTGGFLTFLFGLFESYKVWPIFSFYPHFGEQFPLFILQQVDSLVRLTVVLAAPIIIAIFVTEFGLGLINRFAPQLNVFVLSMPIKSAIASFLLILYTSVLIYAFKKPLCKFSSYSNLAR